MSVQGLLADLPRQGDSWTSGRRDAWFDAFRFILDYAYPVDDSPSAAPAADPEGG